MGNRKAIVGILECSRGVVAALRIALKLRATRPPRAVEMNDSSCAPAHNTPLPLERSPPVSFKRLLGGPRVHSQVIGNTYEATGVKRVQLPSPPAMSRRLSCERAPSDVCMRAVFRRSLSITDEPGDGSDTYARSAAPHDLAIRAGRVN